MVKPDGQLFDEIGQIRNGRLAVLDATFVPTPDTLRMYPVKTSKTEQTKPVKGFDIKYDGVRDGKMWFTVWITVRRRITAEVLRMSVFPNVMASLLILPAIKSKF